MSGAPAPRLHHPPEVVKVCRSCKAPVIWLYTSKGKAMPVDANTVQPGHTDMKFAPFLPDLGHRSHFAGCPDAQRWRR